MEVRSPAFSSFDSFNQRFVFLTDDTTSQGKGKIKESKDENFAKAIEALTYQAPVTRAAVKK